MTLEGLEKIKERKGNKTDDAYAENGQREGTNIESGTSRRAFGVWLRSMGLALVDCPMHLADGALHRSELCQ